MAASMSADPWGTLIYIGVFVGACALPFLVCGVTDLFVRGLNIVFPSENAEFDHMNAGIAAGFIVAFIEILAFFFYVIPHYS